MTDVSVIEEQREVLDEDEGLPALASAGADRGASPKREQSRIKFPYFGLAEAVETASVVHHRYGGRCGIDQLAAALDQKPSSGAFRLKLSATRLFGFVTVSGQTVSITDEGARACDERTAPAALAGAFLQVPLYRELYERFRNRTLPSNIKGLEEAIRDLGVATKQVPSARQAFQRSATTAGFFAHGTDRLVMPAVATLEGGKQAPELDGGDGDAARDQDQPESEHPILKDPLIIGLLERLPDPDDDFPEPERHLWLATLEMNLAFIYSRPTKWKFERPDPPEAKHVRAQEATAETAIAPPHGSRA